MPSDLLDHPPPTTTSTTPNYEQVVQIYFIRTGKYVAPVAPPKKVPAPVTLKSVLQVLVTTGPSTVDTGNGYQSALTPTVKLLGATVTGNLATVDFNKAFGLISGSLGALAVAQVVFTITSNLAAVTNVTFQIGGQPTQVPSATGALVPSPVTAAAYASLLQPPAPPTTTAPTSSSAG